MTKKFMYVCVGILALVVAFHMGTQCGSASIVDRSETGIIACHRSVSGAAAFFLMDSGETYYCDSMYGWSAGNELPVSASEVKFFDDLVVVTYSNEVWIRDGSHYPEEPWRNMGPPAGYVSTQPTTWGRIKAEFRE